MTIQDLADRAGVTTRTIRYYVEQGVLPPPERGRPAEYTDEHLQLLDLVRRLKEQYLPLEEIRDMLQRLSVDQLEDFLNRTERQPAQPAPSNSAADYVSQVLSRGALRSQLKEQAAVIPPPAAPAPATAPSPILPTRRRQAEQQAPAADSKAETPMMAAQDPEILDAYKAAEPLQTTGEERTWQRVSLAPGVELHYEVPASGARRTLVHKLIEAARSVLGTEPGKGTEERK